MKKYLYITILSLVISACGGGGGTDSPPDPPPPVNKAPNKPVQTAPTNNLLCTDNTVQFQWNSASDPDGDSVSYELQIATNNSFSENLQSSTISSTSATITLEKGVAYYWRIRAKDSKGATSDYSSTFSFYTEGEGVSNHLPFSPSIVSPELNAVVQTESVDLSWTASDVDTEDTLTFDVYFGTDIPPTEKIATDISETTLNQSLEASKTYYWKVVVKDDNGGITIGQIWGFKTD